MADRADMGAWTFPRPCLCAEGSIGVGNSRSNSNTMKHLVISVAREFTPEMERLRRSAYHDSTGEVSSSDEFDACSVHVIASLDGALAGMVRMTPEPPSVLQTWFRGKAPLPTGPGVVDANRAVVSETSRGLGIYKVLMVEALAWARGQKAAHVVGTIELTFPIREFLKETGCAAGSGSKSLRACWPPRFGRAGKAIQPRSWSLLRALRAAMSRS